MARGFVMILVVDGVDCLLSSRWRLQSLLPLFRNLLLLLLLHRLLLKVMLNLLHLPPCCISSLDCRGLAAFVVTVCIALVRRVVFKLTVYASTSRFMFSLEQDLVSAPLFLLAHHKRRIRTRSTRSNIQRMHLPVRADLSNYHGCIIFRLLLLIAIVYKYLYRPFLRLFMLLLLDLLQYLDLISLVVVVFS